MTVLSDWDDLMVSMGLEPSEPPVSPLWLLAHPPVPCGTVSGFRRHYTNGEEPCRVCRDARNADQRARRAARRPPKPVSLKKRKQFRAGAKQGGQGPVLREHGTPRGARQHWFHHEAVCDACRVAYNVWQAEHRARRREDT